MATLSGNKIKDTYQSLVKFSDNGNITTSAKQLTDGFGNNSPMYVSTTQVGIGVTPESGLNLHVYGDAKIGSNLTVIGNLVVEGSTTTVGTDTLTVKDPLIVLANNNTSTDAVDIGFYGKYTPSGTTLYSGLFREALTGKYRLFKDLQVEPTTTVNTSGTGYAVATLIANLEGDVTGNLIGSVTGGTFSGTLLSNVVATTQSANDNSTKVATTAYVDNQVGLYDTLSEVLANGNTSGANDIIMADSQKVNYGTGSDLQIYHDATDSYIKNDTGNLIIEQTTDDADIIFKNDNGSGDTIEYFRIDGSESRIVYGRSIHMADNVSIFLGNDDDGLIRYDSTANKILYTGTSQFSGNVDFQGNINLGDNNKIIFGDGGDVEMFFNGSTFVIDDTVEVFGFDIDTNLIRFRGTDLYTEISNGQHTFWTNGTERFKINATEVKVSHQLNVTGDLIVDTDTLFVDASEDSVGIGLTNPADYTADELVISVPDESGMTLVSGTTDAAYISFADATGTDSLVNYIRYDHNDDTMSINNFGGSIKFSTGEAINRMTINTGGVTVDDDLIVDGNVGIGVNNPSDYYFTASDLVVGGSSNHGITIATGDANTGAIHFADGTSGTAEYAGYIAYQHNDNKLRFGANASDKLVIDSSGNVGIGVTPHTSTFKTLEIGNGDNVGNISNDTLYNDFSFGSGCYFNSGWKYAKTGEGAALIRAYGYNGQFFFQRAGSGTKGNAITWDIPMVIDTSGNVGIGVTSPDIKLDVVEAIRIQAQSGGTNNATLVLTARNGGAYGNTLVARSDIQSTTDGTAYGSDLLFKTTDSSNTKATRMTIDSSGNVGIGTTSPSTKLQVKDSQDSSFDSGISVIRSASSQTGYINMVGGAFNFNAPSGVPIRFRDGGTANVTIDGSGNVGIGTTSPAALLDVAGNIYGVRLYVNSGGNATDPMIRVKTDTNTGIFFPADDTLAITTGGTERMRIESDGGMFFPSLGGFSVSNSDVRYNATSDELYYQTSSKRYKSEITDLENSLDKVNNLRPVRFKDNLSQEYATGMIAEEVAEIIPEVVFTKPIDGFDEPQIEGINYSDIVPFLIKSIQELKAEIELLKTQINN